MSNIRIIARLDVKSQYLIKGVNLEGLRKLGDPNAFASRYYMDGIDEILYMDIVASLYNRASILEIVRKTTQNVFIPITVGGGIRSVDDARDALRSGADKVAVNTAAIKNPGLISEIASTFGSQCMVISIEARKKADNRWEAYHDNGREKTGLDAVDWAQKACSMGAGEILLTSIDMEGTCRGFDYELVRTVVSSVDVPVIASGGMGNFNHFEKVVRACGADAVAIAHVLHYNKMTVSQIRKHALEQGINVRKVYE